METQSSQKLATPFSQLLYSPGGAKENSPGRQPWEYGAEQIPSPGRGESQLPLDSVAPPGLFSVHECQPTAHAVGYALPPLRGSELLYSNDENGLESWEVHRL